MRILHAAPGMSVGGAERLVVELADGLVARGHTVLVSGPPGRLDGQLGGVGRVLLPERGRSPLGAAEGVMRLAAAIRRERPDVIHGHNVKASFVAAVAARVARGPRRPPVIATFHGVLPAEYPAAARLLRAADRVVCVSAELAEGLASHGIPTVVVRNGVTLPEGEVVGGEIAGAGRPLVVAVGRLVEQKNHERLLHAARHVRDRGVSAGFAIVGDGPLRERLTARAAELEVDVLFTGARDDAPAVMARADLVAFSSDWEGLSVAALEALAAGTPVVSTPVEGMRELLATGAGTLTASMDPHALGDAIVELLGDAPRRAAMGAEGRRLVAERFSASAMLDAYERLYRELVS
jgi:glycosyltransferase involved in cell wall biosynthesis